MKRIYKVYRKTVSIVSETSTALYENLAGMKKGFLLESYDKNYDRYTFPGADPEEILTSEGIFAGIPSPVKAARYHSLAVSREGLPDCLEITAETADGEIMAMRHRKAPVVGLQFHPESICTEHGKRMIENFVNGRI